MKINNCILQAILQGRREGRDKAEETGGQVRGPAGGTQHREVGYSQAGPDCQRRRPADQGKTLLWTFYL